MFDWDIHDTISIVSIPFILVCIRIAGEIQKIRVALEKRNENEFDSAGK